MHRNAWRGYGQQRRRASIFLLYRRCGKLGNAAGTKALLSTDTLLLLYIHQFRKGHKQEAGQIAGKNHFTNLFILKDLVLQPLSNIAWR